MRNRALFIAIVAATLGVSRSGFAAEYALTKLTVPGTISTAAFDVNNLGQVVGYAESDLSVQQAFVYSAGSYTMLTGPAGAASVTAFGISDGGTIVGSYWDSTAIDAGGSPLGTSRGFILDGGKYSVFAIPGANYTEMRGISSDGRYITGRAEGGFGTTANGAFVLDRTSGAITWVTEGPASTLAIVQGINSSGVVAGDERTGLGTGSPKPVAFTYDFGAAARVNFNIAGARRTAFRDISDSGVIAGYFSDAGGEHGFVGSAASYQTFNFGDVNSTFLEGINNAGWLVGASNNADGTSFGFVLTPVPEPNTLVLAVAGLGLILRRWRAH